jgi:O-methyltransferase
MLLRTRKRLIDAINWYRLPPIAREVRRQHLTYLSEAKLLSLRDIIRDVNRHRIGGDFIEYGIALGGSAVYLASERGAERRFRGFDVFGMIPAPGEQDDQKSKARYEVIRSGQSRGLGDDVYYGYQENLFDRVCGTFKSFGMPVDSVSIVLNAGLFADTVTFSSDDRVALAHVDCDWYDPVRLCLERTWPVLASGGFIILDDYNDYGGCRKAAEEFLAGLTAFRLLRTIPHAVIQKL